METAASSLTIPVGGVICLYTSCCKIKNIHEEDEKKKNEEEGTGRALEFTA